MNLISKIVLIGYMTLLPTIASAGSATFYSDYYNGRRTASGRIFSQGSNTIATNNYPLGTRLKICYRKRCVVGVVRDRCNCSYDLSKSLFRQLSSLKKGRIPVQVKRI